MYYVVEIVDCLACGGTGRKRYWDRCIGSPAGVEENCRTCRGTGTVERRVSLAEALRALGVACGSTITILAPDV